MDVVRIKGLKVETVVGVHAWERKLPRTVVVDVELACDVARAARSDALADAVDYAAVARVAGEFVGAQQFQLVETLVERLAEKLMAEFGAPWVRLELHKPGAIPGAAGVSVMIERGTRAGATR